MNIKQIIAFQVLAPGLCSTWLPICKEALLGKYKSEARKMCCSACKSCRAVLASCRAVAGICTMLTAWRWWGVQHICTWVTIITRPCANLVQQHLSFLSALYFSLFLYFIPLPHHSLLLCLLAASHILHSPSDLLRLSLPTLGKPSHL